MNDVQGLYLASFARLVGVVQAVAGSRADAEEAVQEAFARLIPRWDTVGRYDDPEAWVRLVAFRICLSRRRRALRQAKVLLRLAVPPVAEDDSDSQDVTEMLRRLPHDHRVVLVMHHVLDLPLEQIARELCLPLGTVKSRLYRSRQAARELMKAGDGDA